MELSAGSIVTFQGLVGSSVLNGCCGVVIQPSPSLNPSSKDAVIPALPEGKVEVVISQQTMTSTGRASQYLKLSIDKVIRGPPVGLSIRHLSIDPEDLGVVESFDAETGLVSIKMSHDLSIRSVELPDILPSEIFTPIFDEFENCRHDFLEKGKQLYFDGKPDDAAIVCLLNLIDSFGILV
jgi:hypothetical protein